MLDVIAKCVILLMCYLSKCCCWKAKMVDVEGHVYNCILCHPHDVDGQIGQSLVVVLGGLWCMLYKQYLGIPLC